MQMAQIVITTLTPETLKALYSVLFKKLDGQSYLKFKTAKKGLQRFLCRNPAKISKL
jgi:hypothetical protein